MCGSGIIYKQAQQIYICRYGVKISQDSHLRPAFGLWIDLAILIRAT